MLFHCAQTKLCTIDKHMKFPEFSEQVTLILKSFDEIDNYNMPQHDIIQTITTSFYHAQFMKITGGSFYLTFTIQDVMKI